MPEIAEVARITHFLKLGLVGKKIAKAAAIDDPNVFGKVGTTGSEVEKALKGKKVVSAGSQGKYFWITLDKPPHLVMHFGMTGWVHIKDEQTAYTNYYKKMTEEEKEQWPPRFWKFQLITDSNPPVEVAFTDARRFGRVRLVDCPGEEIRKHSPLVENGPDPVNDLDRFTEEYLRTKMRAKRVPIKALLLDQAMISGIGNWVADELLYQAKVHPEQYCNEFSDDEIQKIYKSVRYVCQTAVDKLGNSDEFPDHWIFNYRWGKGSKDAATKLPNGEKIAWITVGGRTSCYAPGVQKKTGHIPKGAKTEVVEADDNGEAPPNNKKKKGRKTSQVKTEIKEEDDISPARKKRKFSAASKEMAPKEEVKSDEQSEESGRRRSTRLKE